MVNQSQNPRHPASQIQEHKQEQRDDQRGYKEDRRDDRRDEKEDRRDDRRD